MLPRSLRLLLIVILVTAASGCAPPVELTASQEELVRKCLGLAFREDPPPECADQVTKPMEKAFLSKHPDFYDRLLADRKAFVEKTLADEQRERDELNRCLDAREAGQQNPTACEKFMPHEITRGLEDRRLRRCAAAQLDAAADAQRHCAGLPASVIEEEVLAERTRRERRR
ncbi:MAG TPA: hypothetical protein VKB34_17295 [Povalibacter sp.]|nr:hypothetical protein [Povalibacter sp.]